MMLLMFIQQSPSVGVIAGNMVTALLEAIQYATLVCSTVASTSNTVNAQPITPVQPTRRSNIVQLEVLVIKL
jgi:hypothetical protein